MKLRRFPIHPILQPYLALIWVFESTEGIPAGDMRTIAPNGEMKLIIPFKHHLTSTIDGKLHEHPESTCSIIGQLTHPAVIDGPTLVGTIGVTFRPSGAYRFFPFAMRELAECIQFADDTLGKQGRELHARVAEAHGAEAKVEVIQAFLISALSRNRRESPAADHAVKEIERSAGRLSIDALSRRMGYTRRHLDREFSDHVGLSPKTLANIIRFQRIYTGALVSRGPSRFSDDLYDFYYDQAHFTKYFKRFTGLPPGKFQAIGNRFGRLFVSPRYVPFVQDPPPRDSYLYDETD